MKKRDRFNTCPAFFVTNFNGLFVLSCLSTSRRNVSPQFSSSRLYVVQDQSLPFPLLLLPPDATAGLDLA